MNEKITKAIEEQLSGLVEKHSFSKTSDGIFKNDKFAFSISHDPDKKMLVLKTAEIGEDGTPGEFETVSSFLFEDEENIRDAESAGMDFLDTLKGKLGIRGVRTSKNGEVAMPSKSSGNSKNMEALCGKLLSVFPQYKETYKEHVSKYGKLLYITFFKQTFVVSIGELLDKNNKKSIKKLFDMLSDMYCNGDHNVQNAIVGILLGGAVCNNQKRYETAVAGLEDYSFLKNALIGINKRVNNDKRFAEMLA